MAFATVETIAQSLESGIIEGQVIDRTSGDGLAAVNVFLTNSRWGAATDPEGAFRIEGILPGRYDVVASMVGYVSQTHVVEVDPGADARLTFSLEPLVYDIEPVEITARRNRQWGRQLETFKRQFLGTSDMAAETTILNPQVLSFDSNFGVLTAEAYEPLEIENRALGYRILLLLDDFTWNPHSRQVRLAGRAYYRELEPASFEEEAIWREYRLRAYEGSVTHLLRSVVAGTSYKEGFRLYSAGSGAGMRLRDEDLLGASHRPNEYRIRLTSTEAVKVEYHISRRESVPGLGRDRRDSPRVSWLRLQRPTATVDRRGLINPRDALVISGDLQERRFADQLPIDYGLNPSDAVRTHPVEPVVPVILTTLGFIDGVPFVAREFGKGDRSAGDRLAQEALVAMQQQDLDIAESRLRSRLDTDPSNATAQYLLGVCLRAQLPRTTGTRQSEEAADLFSEIITRDSTYRDVLFQYALLKDQIGDRHAAIRLGEAQLRLRPDLAHAAAGLYRIYRPFVLMTEPAAAVAQLARWNTPHSTYFRSEALRLAQDTESAWAVLVGLRQQDLLWPEQPLLLSMVRLAAFRGEEDSADRYYAEAVSNVEDRFTAELIAGDLLAIMTEEEKEHYLSLESAAELRRFLTTFWEDRQGGDGLGPLAAHYVRLHAAECRQSTDGAGHSQWEDMSGDGSRDGTDSDF